MITHTSNETNIVLDYTNQNFNPRTTGINFLKKFANNLLIANLKLPYTNGNHQDVIEELSILLVFFHKKPTVPTQLCDYCVCMLVPFFCLTCLKKI